MTSTQRQITGLTELPKKCKSHWLIHRRRALKRLSGIWGRSTV